MKAIMRPLFCLLLSLGLWLLVGCESMVETSSISSKEGAGTSANSFLSENSSSDTSANFAVKVGERAEFNGKQWEVTFSDDFDGTRLNSQNWTYSQPVKRADYNNYWNRKQVSLSGDGFLQLGIDYDAESDRILSGAITSDRIFEQTYGYFECRAKLQAASGCWSAFWLMSNDIIKVGNGGQDGAEIDIFESPFFNLGTVQSALHWDGYLDNHQSVAGPQYRLHDMYYKFHTFALEWTKDAYVFYVDGKETWRTDAGGVCEVPCYMQLSVEAGSWGGDFIKEQMPACFTVDYVRVYKEI